MAMSFEKFMTSMQSILTGFEVNDKLLTEVQKI